MENKIEKKGRTMKKNNRNIKDGKVFKLVELSILTAIMIVFAFTPVGYLKLGVISITFLPIPIALGAYLLGIEAGAFLGLVFGLTSLVQCFGLDPFGTFLFSLSPVKTVMLCIIPRIICGVLAGLISKWLKNTKIKPVSYYITALTPALANTIFFTSFLLIFFWGDKSFISKMQEYKMTTDTLWLFCISFVGINGIVESAVSMSLGGVICKYVGKVLRRN